MSAPHDALAAEARVFGRYLLGRPVGVERAIALYVRAAPGIGSGFDARDAAVAAFAAARPWSIGALDAALALARPAALLRQKLLLMAAILEVQPEYCDDFLPADRGAAEFARAALAVIRGAFDAAAGAVLLRVVR